MEIFPGYCKQVKFQDSEIIYPTWFWTLIEHLMNIRILKKYMLK